MMSISSLLSDQPNIINSKSFSRPSSSSPPIIHSQPQKVIQTIRPNLSPTNSNNSAMGTSPNLSESSNDEQSGIMHQTISSNYSAIDNSDVRTNSGFYQKMHYHTVQIHHHELLSRYNSTPQINPNQDITIPPLLTNNNNKNKINIDNQKNTGVPNSTFNTNSKIEMKIPEATYYEKDGMKYAIRCVCGEPHDDGFLVQCEKCEMWLHGPCVNYSRNVKGEHFYCPFCLKIEIQCVCGNSMDYDLPLIKCQKCGKWSHKSCENIEFGIIPSNFICTKCRKLEKSKLDKVFYEIPYVKFSEKDTDIPDFTIFTTQNSLISELNLNSPNLDKSAIISSIPDGPFQKMIEEDLNFAELNFRSFIEKYFHKFAPIFFDRIHEFYRIFNDTVCAIFNVKKNLVLRALDVLANHLLYNQSSLSDKAYENNDTDNEDDFKYENDDDDEEPNNDIEHSEAISQYLSESQVPRLEKIPTNIELYTDPQKASESGSSYTSNKKNRRKRKKTENEENNNTACNDFLAPDNINSHGGVFTPVSLDDGAFITEISGFLIHTDEIKADSGIPYSSILLTDDALIIDTSGTPFQQFSTHFRRSFHFNCIAKLIRIKGDLRVALFATRLQGPLSEEKTKRGDAILANGELILPFDGYIPFPTEKIEWKDRRRRKFSSNYNLNTNNFLNKGTQNGDMPDFTKISSYLSNTHSFDAQNDTNEKTIDASHKEATRKPKKKITQQTVAKRCTLNPNLTLLSTFMDGSVPPMPFIVLSDQEDIDVYKSQMERINARILSQ